MQPSNTHLDPERLAAFDDEPFTADEQTHLAACAACRGELEAVRAVVALTGTIGRAEPEATVPRLVEFDAIAAGLRRGVHDEGVRSATPLATASGTSRRPAAHGMGMMTPLVRRAAAALLLVSGGAVLGRLTDAGPNGSSIGAGAASVVGVGAASVRPVALTDSPFADRSYGSVEDATSALNRAQREYERASLWLASNDTTMRDPDVFRARLAALDQMMEASRVALRDAPQDPVLNHYYLAAYSAREATLQALGGALPVDKIIERY